MTTLPRTRIRARRASGTPAARALARAGLTARGIIYILIGWVAVLVALVGILVIDAAVSHHPAASRGVDKALLLLRNQAAGPVLLVLVVFGLVIFGGYGLCEARWRRV
jgi:uncharacterized membrane protein